MAVSVTAAVLGVRHGVRWARRYCENALVTAEETLTIDDRIELLVGLRATRAETGFQGVAERRERARGG